ncbi:MAG: hypothetical protein B6D58_00755 [candidate division Zixibacteria bacterium 4484_95]|nr:MAG: hypothetical protein B6D58_00755 [candidate division Zixibacteria bacterium 4484_95]
MADQQLIYNCPGCGKPTPSPEGALTNKCEYCNLVVRIGGPHRILKYFYPTKINAYGARIAVDRYLKKQGLPLSGKIIKSEFFYLPFYRFRGMALDYLAPTVEMVEVAEDVQIPARTKCKLKGKEFDITIPAFTDKEFGLISLGIRPHAVPLYAFSRQDIPEGTTIVSSDIPPHKARHQAMEIHKHNVSLYNKSKPIYSAMIGERLSVIYFPIWAVTHETNGMQMTVFVDALADRGYSHKDKPFDYKGKISTEENSYFLRPLRHQCPYCGADLKERYFSLFYPCKNCGRSYLLRDEGYSEVKCQAVDTPLCVPFWRFPLEFNGQRHYKTVRDFSKLLPAELALMRKQKKNNRFYLYSPAFKATDVNRWVKRALSVIKTQPHDKLYDRLPALGPVLCIDEDEAKEMAVFLWRVATSKYVNLRKGEFQFDVNYLQSGEVIWLPVEDHQLLGKSLGYKEVNVLKN